MGDTEKIPNPQNFIPSKAPPPNESEFKSPASMLAKDVLNNQLDFILRHISLFSQEYCITFEQSVNFITKRYYQRNYNELSEQVTLECYIEPLPQRDLEGKQIIILHTKDHRIIIKKEED
jgi:hypothetical protein